MVSFLYGSIDVHLLVIVMTIFPSDRPVETGNLRASIPEVPLVRACLCRLANEVILRRV